MAGAEVVIGRGTDKRKKLVLLFSFRAVLEGTAIFSFTTCCNL